MVSITELIENVENRIVIAKQLLGVTTKVVLCTDNFMVNQNHEKTTWGENFAAFDQAEVEAVAVYLDLNNDNWEEIPVTTFLTRHISKLEHTLTLLRQL